MSITPSMADIQKLRQDTGARIMDCKEALISSDNDLETAKEWLRKKGIVTGAKRTERVAGEGVIAASALGGEGSLVEINSETDFVARSQEFLTFAKKISDLSLKQHLATIEHLKTTPFEQSTVQDSTLGLAGSVGENIVLRRIAHLSVNPGVVVSYTHLPLAPGLGRIGVLVALKSSASPEQLAAIGKKLAMHVAAKNPLYLSQDQIPQEVLQKEEALLKEQASTENRPPEVAKKVIEGRLQKFVNDITLMGQEFVIEPGKKVKDFLEEESKALGVDVVVDGFERYVLGADLL